MQYDTHYSSIIDDLSDYKDHLREGLLKYTVRAFELLPKIKNPSILDIGCGSGVPTIELARLSDGKITAIDIDRRQLDRLREKVRKSKLGNRINVVESSMTDMHLEAESFNIIWAEGSIAVIGFENGIIEWKSLLKPGGFLVVHDDRGNIGEKMLAILHNQYVLIGSFEINEDIWWEEYYKPLNDKLIEIRNKYHGDSGIENILQNDQEQIDRYHNNRSAYRSAFFILKKV